jgi:hypothetical protein
MKQYRSILLFEVEGPRRSEDGTTLSPALFRELNERWPQPERPGKFGYKIEVLEDDPMLAEMIVFLQQHGREPYFKKYPCAPYEHPSLYRVESRRVFEPDDFAKAEYFYFYPEKEIGGGRRHEGTEFLELDYHRLKKHPIGWTSQTLAALCTDELRQEFEAQSFTGLTFRKVFLNSRKPVHVAYWQLWADRLMPPLQSRLVNEDGTDFDPAKIKGCRVDDEFFPALLHFSKTQVHDMGTFDAALTREALGPGNRPYQDPQLIVSRRFRDWCLKRKLKIEWIPVVLE